MSTWAARNFPKQRPFLPWVAVVLAMTGQTEAVMRPLWIAIAGLYLVLWLSLNVDQGWPKAPASEGGTETGRGG